MTRTTNENVGDELRGRLHPADDRDVPIPGFATHDALVAWARSRPSAALMDAAVEVLRNDGWPQQYAAMGLLRALGAQVEGVGYGDGFRWRVTPPGRRPSLVVEPVKRPA